MKHILFVDDEPNILEGLERMLFPLQRHYKMTFAGSGKEAIEYMKEAHFDVIVSDMRMPGMDGAQLLAEVKRSYPDTLRFILTGQSDSETVMRAARDAHQFISKPCKPALLQECVDRALALRDLLASDTIKLVVAQIDALPPVPELYTKLCAELQSPEGSIANVGRIIETDPAMTAKLLQLVNSAFFALRQHVTTAVQAASLLGFETINALVLVTGLFDSIQRKGPPALYSVDTLWTHSMHVGQVARAIARMEAGSGVKDRSGDAYTAGLLHDVGRLVLAAFTPDDYGHACETAQSRDMLLVEAEREVYGCTHAEVGAYLMGVWGLPSPIVEAAAYHHAPGILPGKDFTPLVAVYAANALLHEKDKGPIRSEKVDARYLTEMGLLDRLPAWREAIANMEEEGCV